MSVQTVATNFHALNGVPDKTGVLIVNLGTPDAPTRGAVYRYLKQFLLDPRVIDINAIARNLLVRGIIAPFRSGESAKGYKLLWTEEGSPLKVNGVKLADMVADRLGDDYVVELAMRYQNPSIESALQKFIAAKVNKITVFTLFPHYASASTGSVHEEVMRLLSKEFIVPEVRMISSYCTYEPMIKLFAENGRKFDMDSYDHILFSYHGIPERHMRKADNFNHCLKTKDCCQTLTATNQYCYSAQCYATTRKLVAELGLKEGEYTQCYQSRLGNDPWMQPYTSDILKKLAEQGMKRLLVFCPAFTSDCLETTVEISDEYAEEFEEMGGEVIDLVPSLNAMPEWADAVAALVR